MSEPDARCPHCGEPLGFNLMEKARDEHRVSMTLTPEPGSLLSGKTVGGVISSAGKLLEAVGRDAGLPLHTVVERIETAPDGTISVAFLTVLKKKPVPPRTCGETG